jgi:PPOX class probable F420-dependent enzyme
LHSVSPWSLRALVLSLRHGVHDYAEAILPGWVVINFGFGLSVPTIIGSATVHLPHELSGTGSAVIKSGRQIGGVFGASLLVVILGPAAVTGEPTRFYELWWVAAALCAAGAVTSLGLTPKRHPAIAETHPTPRCSGGSGRTVDDEHGPRQRKGHSVTTLQEAASLSSDERGLVVVSTLRANGTIQSSLVNAGVLAHPATGETILALVASGPVKLANLRARPQVTATFRNGWQWAAVEGRAELAGPDDPQPWLDTEGLRLLLRAIFTAAGGDHGDWDGYDRVMAQQRRAAVLIRPDRVYSN